jgi:hypothetical protein
MLIFEWTVRIADGATRHKDLAVVRRPGKGQFHLSALRHPAASASSGAALLHGSQLVLAGKEVGFVLLPKRHCVLQ